MLDDSAVIVFENFLDVKLPLDYREYLKNINETRPIANAFDIPNQGYNVVNRFFSLIAKNKNETLIYQLKQYKNRIPSEMLPIGNDPGGNLLLIALKGSSRGGVYFWDHNFEADGESQPFYKNIIALSPNFSTFLNSLYDAPSE